MGNLKDISDAMNEILDIIDASDISHSDLVDEVSETTREHLNWALAGLKLDGLVTIASIYKGVCIYSITDYGRQMLEGYHAS